MPIIRPTLACLVALTGCSQPPGGHLPPQVELAVPTHAASSALFLQYPQYDQRVVELRLPSTEPAAAHYPDRWLPDTTAVLDMAVDRSQVYTLLARRGQGSALYAASRDDGSAKAIGLPAAPVVLSWARPGLLLVGHYGGTTAKGSLSMLDTQKGTAVSLPLEGGCTGIAASSKRAFVLERVERLYGAKDVLLSYSLAAFDLETRTLTKRVALPAGPRQVVIGPSGLLYISHVSAEGRHATDGTISVLHSETLELVDRLRVGMSVTRMAANGSYLALTLLKPNNDAYFSLLDRTHQTVFDYRLSQLTSDELLLVGDLVYVPMRQEHALERIDLAKKKRLPRLQLGKGPYRDGVGLLRAELAVLAIRTGGR